MKISVKVKDIKIEMDDKNIETPLQKKRKTL
jgi:hypothetical protein